MICWLITGYICKNDSEIQVTFTVAFGTAAGMYMLTNCAMLRKALHKRLDTLLCCSDNLPRKQQDRPCGLSINTRHVISALAVSFTGVTGHRDAAKGLCQGRGAQGYLRSWPYHAQLLHQGHLHVGARQAWCYIPASASTYVTACSWMPGNVGTWDS
jgi:hypothetical protein